MSQKIRLVGVITILWVVLLLPQIILAQDHEVTGTIKDAAGKPISGVTVVVKGSSKITTSDSSGKFSITTLHAKSLLEFNYVGYKTKTADVKAVSSINIVLEEAKTQLSEVVVVGYGTQKKSDITGAISSIKNKDFKDQPVSNLATSIEGKLSGINVTQPSGTPGAGLMVSIRGSQNPLYVVDGVPMLSENNSALPTSYNISGSSVGSGQSVSSISDINPDDIESIEVLKDASAAAIYGARAANGVVLVTTKRGKSGKTSFDVNYYTGFQNVEKKIKFLNSQQFYNLTNQAIANDIQVYNNESSAAGMDTSRFGPLSVLQSVGIVDGNGAAIPNPVAPYYNLASGVNTNWENAIFRTAPINNYEVSARGGNEKTKFYIGGGYFDQTGIILNNYFRRYNVRVNIENQATERLSFGTTITLAMSDNKRSFNDNTYTGIVTNALGASPLMPVYNSDGSYADFTQYQASWLSDNPVKSAKEINAHTLTDRIIASAFGEYKILSSLKFRTSWSLDYADINDNQFFPLVTVDAQTAGGSKLLIGHLNSFTWLNENMLTFQKSFNKDNLTILGGFTQQQTKTQTSSAKGIGFPSLGSNVPDISEAASIFIPINPYAITNHDIQSFVTRVNYDHDGKYLLTATMRADASSRFPANQRWGYFPSGSAGWNIAREKFLEDNKYISSLKLRVSYGLTGDESIPDYYNQVYWGPARYNGTGGLSLNNLVGNKLTWQENTTFNTGLDFDLFHHFINGSIEYFNSQRNRIFYLGQEPVAGTTGFAGVYANSGKVVDNGLEIQLTTNNIQTKKFSWTSSFNISFLKNKIKALAVDSTPISSYNDQAPTNILKIGQPVGTFIGVKFAGVNPHNGDAEYYAADGSKERADQVNFTRDATIIGNARPKFFGGFTNNFRYKNFDLVIATQFTVGNKVFNLIRTTYESLGWSGASTPGSSYLAQVYANNDTRVLNAWKKPGDKTNIPRPSFLLQNYFPNSDEFLESGSFFKIRTVNLGYTIRKSKYFNSIRFYAQAQNLLTFSKYIGFDPEVSSTGGGSGSDQTAGIDYAAYPQARTITFGLNVNL
jgi:TonB-linked SusC/RagA family outer membrane protein